MAPTRLTRTGYVVFAAGWEVYEVENWKNES
jgi:hypothetical protein